MKRDFLSLIDLRPEEVVEVIENAKAIKENRKKGKPSPQVLAGKAAALIFHKPSLRTRASFEVGVRELGGSSVYITDQEISIGKREAISDVAKVMSRYFGLICIRTFGHEIAVDLAKYASVPVVNMLTDLCHPCQVLCDMLTIYEHLGRMKDLTITYLGDGNNITHSWLNMASLLPMDLRIGTSAETLPSEAIVARTKKAGLSKITVTSDPIEAVKGADVVYTDVWASMGQKHLADQKKKQLAAFQINKKLLSHASKKAIVMHCLPANRGEEITDEVMDGPQSVVFDQAENRLHGQKALIVKLFGG